MSLSRTALALVLATLPGMAAAEMTEAEREAFRQEVRAYLLENPEVLMEAISVLEDRQAAAEITQDSAMVSQNGPAIFADDHSWVGGNPEGDITVVEFMDYRCGFCRKANPEVDELLRSDGRIRYIVKEFPILGPESDLSSRFAIAVLQLHGPEIYEQVHAALISLRAEASQPTLDRLAVSMDLDPAAITAKMGSPEVEEVIKTNHALAQQLAISGTPTFIIGDRMLRGYVPLDEMKKIVAEERG